jgi:NADPH:quinone reductase-like Zn-dependent oxidoreductase
MNTTTQPQIGTSPEPGTAADLHALRDLIESGQIAPSIDRTYALSEAAAAIAHVHDGKHEARSSSR